MFSENTLLHTGRILFNGALLLSAKLLKKADGTFTGGVLTEVAAVIAEGFALKHITDFGTYDKVMDRLTTSHPDDINHDVERLFKEATLVSLGFIEVLYAEELRKDLNYFEGCSKEEIKRFFKDLSYFFSKAKKELKSYIEEQEIKKEMIDTPGDFFTELSNHLIEQSDITFDNISKQRLKEFYAQHIPFCFQLAFKETLKNDELGFKAFELWVLDDLKKSNSDTTHTLARIEEAISQVNSGHHVLSADQLDAIGNHLVKTLEDSFKGVKFTLLRLNEEISENFERHYQISVRIIDKLEVVEDKLDALLDITQRSARDNHQLHRQMELFIEKFMAREDIQRTQRIFAGSDEIKKLIDEIKTLPTKIENRHHRYVSLKEIADTDPNEYNTAAADEAYKNLLSDQQRLEQLNKVLDDQKASVLSNYHLLYGQSEIAERSETTQQAIVLYEAGKFEELEAFLSSDSREREREFLIKEQEKLDEKKKDFALGDLMNAQTIIRNLSNHDKMRLAKAIDYFEKSITIYAYYENQYAYAKFLSDLDPNAALVEFIKALTFVEKESYNYGLILVNIGSIYFVLTEMDSAEEYYVKGINCLNRLYETIPDKVSKILMGALSNLGMIYYQENHIAKAEALYNEALELCEKETDVNKWPAEKIAVLTNLAQLLYGIDKRTESDALTFETWKLLEDYRSVNDNYDLKTAFSVYQNMGGLHYSKRNYADAEIALLTAKTIYNEDKRVKDANFIIMYPALLTCLGALYDDTDRAELALETFDTGITFCKEFASLGFLGFNDILSGLLGLKGQLLMRLYRFDECKIVLEQGISLQRILFASNRDAYAGSLAKALTELGKLHIDLSQPEESLVYLLEAEVLLRNQMENKPNVLYDQLAKLLNEIAAAYSKLGKYEKAEFYYDEQIDLYNLLSVNEPEAYEDDLALAMNNIGYLYIMTGREIEAEAFLLKALVIREKFAIGGNNGFADNLANTQTNLGILYCKMERFAEAEDFYFKSLAIREIQIVNIPGQYVLDYAKVLCNIGNLYFYWKKWDLTEVYYKKSLDVYKDLAIPNPIPFDFDAAELFSNLGLCYKYAGKTHNLRKEMYKNALDIYLKHNYLIPEKFKHLSAVYENLANIYVQENNLDKILECVRKQWVLAELFNKDEDQREKLDGYIIDLLNEYSVRTDRFEKSLYPEFESMKAIIAGQPNFQGTL